MATSSSSPEATTTLHHPSLGTITGITRPPSINQYLGLQYATLTDRLAAPVLKTPSPSSHPTPINATQHGPTAYSAPGGFESEVNTFIQSPIPNREGLVVDELNCLNLSVTVPADAERQGRPLPVFIWVHGGGYVVGSHSWPHYDHAELVRLSVREGRPVVGVGINYRLGLPGFLTSEELRAAGYKGNNFLRDQRAAFEWVRKYISGFGGDPENVTVVGESAGAMAVSLHLFSQQPLFHRAFLTGGTALVRPALPPQVHEMTYNATIKALNLDSLSPKERLEQLLTIPMDTITKTLPPSIQPNAVIDQEIIHAPVSFEGVLNGGVDVVPGKAWLKGLCIGDCQFDASVLYWLAGHLKPLSTKFPGSVRKSLASWPEQAEKLLGLYDFGEGVDEERAFIQVLRFMCDASFHLGTVAFAKGFSSNGEGLEKTKVNVFAFNEPNPWKGKFKGEATHVLDVVFLFQNFNDKLEPAQREAARQMGRDFVKFVSGEEPWKAATEGEMSAKVYGPSIGGGGEEAVSRVVQDVTRSGDREAGRKSEVVEIAEVVGWDVLGGVFVDFMLGKYLS